MAHSKTQHGGKRPGAGRPADHGVRKVSVTVRLTPAVRDYLQDCSESQGSVIETTLRRSAAFKRWVGAQS